MYDLMTATELLKDLNDILLILLKSTKEKKRENPEVDLAISYICQWLKFNRVVKLLKSSIVGLTKHAKKLN